MPSAWNSYGARAACVITNNLHQPLHYCFTCRLACSLPCSRAPLTSPTPCLGLFTPQSNDFMDALAAADPLLAAEVSAGGAAGGGGRASHADKFLMSIDALPPVPPLLPPSLIPPGYANALVMTTGDAGAGLSNSGPLSAAAGAAGYRRHQQGMEAHAALERVAEEQPDVDAEGTEEPEEEWGQGRRPRRGAASRAVTARSGAPREVLQEGEDEGEDDGGTVAAAPWAARAAGSSRGVPSARRQLVPASPMSSPMMTSPMRSPTAPARTFVEGPTAAAAVAAAGAIMAPQCRAVAGVLGGGTTSIALGGNGHRGAPPQAAPGPSSFSAPFGGGGGGSSLSGNSQGGPVTARALFMMDGAGGLAGGGGGAGVTFADGLGGDCAPSLMPPPPPFQHGHGHGHHNLFADPRYGAAAHDLEAMNRQQLSAPAVLEHPGAAMLCAGAGDATATSTSGVSGGGCGGGVGGGSVVSSAADPSGGLFAGPAAMLASLTAAAAAGGGVMGMAASAPQPQVPVGLVSMGTGHSSGSQLYASAASVAPGGGGGLWAEQPQVQLQQHTLHTPAPGMQQHAHSQAAPDVLSLQQLHSRDKASPLRSASFSRGSVGSSTRSPRRAHLNAAIQAVVKAASASPSPSPLARGSDGRVIRRGAGAAAAAGFAGSMESPLAGSAAAAAGGNSRAGSVAPQLPPLPTLPQLPQLPQLSPVPQYAPHSDLGDGAAHHGLTAEMGLAAYDGVTAAGVADGAAAAAEEAKEASTLAAAIAAATTGGGSVDGFTRKKGGAKAAGGGRAGRGAKRGGAGSADIGSGSDDMDAGSAPSGGGAAPTAERPSGVGRLGAAAPSGRGSQMDSGDEESGGGGGGDEEGDGGGVSGGGEGVSVVNLRKVTQDGAPRQLTKQSLKDVSRGVGRGGGA